MRPFELILIVEALVEYIIQYPLQLLSLSDDHLISSLQKKTIKSSSNTHICKIRTSISATISLIVPLLLRHYAQNMHCALKGVVALIC